MPDLEKQPNLVIVHTGSNDLKSVNSPEKIANEIISLGLSVKRKDHQFTGTGVIPRADRFSRKGKEVRDYLEV